MSGLAADGVPVWGAGAGAVPRPALDGSVRTEVAIVGGGVAGLSSALHLARAGLDVLLLESARIGAGATGTSAGVVAPQLVRTTPAKVLRRLGRDRGTALLRFVAESGRHLFDLIDREGLACDARPAGFLAPAAGQGAARRLDAVIEEWRGVRSDLSLLDAAEVAQATGCRGYGAAIHDASGGAVDPLLLARGLADLAEQAGARLHEASAVCAVEGGPGAWRLRTAGGEVLARTVILAANGGNAALRHELRGSVLPLPVCEVATEPLPAEMRAAILPGGESMTDLETDVFSIRYAAGFRLVTAFPASDRLTHEAATAGVNARLAAMLSVHRPLALDHVWQGTAWVNTDLLPRLVRVAEGLVAVQACNGRGLATNVLIGREVARSLGHLPGQPLLALEPPRRVSGFLIARHLPRLILAAGLATKKIRSAFTR
ncbi:glycine/D-amino acid oxidase-like deaminating enzyme [Sphingomonas zeicaulis]|uniref:NAD(P)/FAD-dependent oxidoreductase n=1 Tax=Sphingomonas zeicaulis TaxID=1632740 RepID=UPI003D19A9F4